MRNGVDQVKAWKDAETSGDVDSEHPAGEVELPMRRGQVARAMVLAGLVVGLGAMAEFGPMATETTGGS